MTKKEFLESIKDVPDDAYIKFGIKEEEAKEIVVVVIDIVGLKFKSSSIIIK